MVIKCPNCNQYVSDTASVCPQCGTYLKEDTKGTVNSEVFPGLIAELKKNLMLQGENHSNEEVWTTINWIDQNGNRDHLLISSAEYDDDDNIIKTNAGLVVKIGFHKDENFFNGIEIDRQFTSLYNFNHSHNLLLIMMRGMIGSNEILKSILPKMLKEQLA